jgi:trk system potassium uptake protein TrkA
MYVLIVGAGKVGWNLARELINKRHEVTVIESDQQRYAVVEQELEHSALYGDGSELWVLERGGIERADLVVAVTGDDEDNILISQVARENTASRAWWRAATTRATSSTSSCSASSR